MQALEEAAAGRLPIYAECGGLMYLAREIRDLEGRVHPMAGVLPFTVRMLPRLKALGYREVTLTASGLLGPAGTTARGHEFHYSEIMGEPIGVPRILPPHPPPGGRAVSEGYGDHNVLASYVHLHFGSNPEVARHLVATAGLIKKNWGRGPGVSSQWSVVGDQENM